MEASSASNPLSAPCHLTNWRSTKRRRKSTESLIFAEKSEAPEIRVCVNRGCSRQGSRAILDVLSCISPPAVAVSSCGCLGRCGAGPNLAVIPPGSVIGHCGTSARAARVLAELCGPEFDVDRNLAALALRKRGEDELEKGNFDEAEAFLAKAIALQPSGGLQFLYIFRSAARLAIGDNGGALGDAEEACRIAPKFPQANSITSLRSFTFLVGVSCWTPLMSGGVGGGAYHNTAYICKGDVFLAMGEWAAAEKAYSNALLIDSSIRRSKPFKARIAKLQEKLILTDALS